MITEITRRAQGIEPAVSSQATLVTQLQPRGLEAVPSTRASIELLPNELLSNILSFLESPKPSSSESILYDEPHFELTKSEHAPLKVASCVSKRWRRTTNTLLFKHAQFVVKEAMTTRPILNKLIHPFFKFVSDNQLRKCIQSFTFIVQNKKISNVSEGEHRSKGFSTFWHSLFKVIDPKELLIVAPAEALGALTSCHVYVEDAWSFDCPCHYLRLLIRHDSPIPLPLVDGVLPHKYRTAGPSQPIVEPVVDPFPVYNVQQDLATHESAQVSENYKPESSSSAAPQPEPFELPRAKVSTIFDIRPWTNLLLNEGSFIRAYATYEFWLRQPPSVSFPPRVAPSNANFPRRSYQTS
jgi:hypothetical protein